MEVKMFKRREEKWKYRVNGRKKNQVNEYKTAGYKKMNESENWKKNGRMWMELKMRPKRNS